MSATKEYNKSAIEQYKYRAKKEMASFSEKIATLKSMDNAAGRDSIVTGLLASLKNSLFYHKSLHDAKLQTIEQLEQIVEICSKQNLVERLDSAKKEMVLSIEYRDATSCIVDECQVDIAQVYEVMNAAGEHAIEYV